MTVKYEDTEGNPLSEPTTLTGKIGLPYESEAKAISGWHVLEIPSNAQGTFSDTAQEVVYVYSAEKENKPEDESGVNKPDSENKTPEEKEQGSRNKDHQTNTQTNTKSKLPATGEELTGQRIMGFLGTSIVLFSFLAIWRRKRKTEN